MFKKYRERAAAERLIEEKFYEQVVEELRSGVKREGLWAKAIASSDGSEEKAKSLYIQYRIQSMKDEITVSEALYRKKSEMAQTLKKEQKEEQRECREKDELDESRRRELLSTVYIIRGEKYYSVDAFAMSIGSSLESTKNAIKSGRYPGKLVGDIYLVPASKTSLMIWPINWA